MTVLLLTSLSPELQSTSPRTTKKKHCANWPSRQITCHVTHHHPSRQFQFQRQLQLQHYSYTSAGSSRGARLHPLALDPLAPRQLPPAPYDMNI